METEFGGVHGLLVRDDRGFHGPGYGTTLSWTGNRDSRRWSAARFRRDRDPVQDDPTFGLFGAVQDGHVLTQPTRKERAGNARA
jgi:hypothetical protein